MYFLPCGWANTTTHEVLLQSAEGSDGKNEDMFAGNGSNGMNPFQYFYK